MICGDSQCSCHESDQISYHPSSEGKYHGVSSAGMSQEEVLDLGLALSALRRFAWRDDMTQKSRGLFAGNAGEGAREFVLELLKVIGCDDGISDKNIGG